MRAVVLSLLVVLAAAPAATADPVPAAVGVDPPVDKAHPAGMAAVAIPSHSAKLNGVLYTASGPGPHPTVLLLHGLPGNEQNLDLAQAMRRDGWTVLTLHYRGAWGTPGVFTFGHCLEDAAAAIEWLRSPDGGGSLGVDRRRIAIVGHSLGGWVAAEVAAHDPDLLGAGLISAADIGATFGKMPRAAAVSSIDDNIGATAGLHTLAGTSPDALTDEAIRNAGGWTLIGLAPALARRPFLSVSSDDGLSAGDQALGDAVGKIEGAEVVQVHLDTDHSYSDRRIALQAAVLRWLENLPGAPSGL